jgi:hypothetical protein
MRPSFILAIIIIACGVSIYQWHRSDMQPPLPEEALRLRASLHYLGDLQRPLKERLSFLLFKRYETSPPLVHVVTIPFYLVGGTDKSVAGMVNILFVSLLIISVYGIGRRLYSETVGLTGAALVASYPIIVGLSKIYVPDIPETTMVTLAMYAALRAVASRRSSWSILLGLICGAGMLIAWHFVIFCVGPLMYLLLSADRKLLSPAPLTARRRNLAFGAGAAALVAGPWYCAHSTRAIASLARGAWGIPSAAALFKSLLFYPCAFLTTVLLVPMTLLLLAGLTIAVVRRKASLLLILWLFVPMILLMPARQKTPRLLMPVLPAAALLTAAGASMVRTGSLRNGITGAAVAVSALNFLAINFGLPWGQSTIFLAVPSLRQKCASCLPLPLEPFRAEFPFSGIGLPRHEDWALKKILSDIATLGEGTSGHRATLGWFISPHPRFNRYSLLYYIDQGGYPVRRVPPDEAQFILARLVTAAQRQQLSEWGKSWALLQKLKNYPLPDGSEAVLYVASVSRRRHYGAPDMPFETGEERVEDPASSSGLARFADRDKSIPGAMVKGPYHPLEKGAYRLLVKLKYDRPKGREALARMEVRARKRDEPLASRDLNLPELGESGCFNPVRLDFEMPGRDRVDIRILHTGRADLWIDSIDIIPLSARTPETGPAPVR